MSEVDHPKHYNTNPSGVECIDVVEHMNFNLGNAMKYLWRAENKGNVIQDLEKSIWYIQREIGRLKKMKDLRTLSDDDTQHQKLVGSSGEAKIQLLGER